MILVAGITRSGLSVTMQMLHAGGVLVCGEPPAFECYGFGEIPWPDIGKRAVKVVDMQLQWPPAGSHDIIYLRRNLEQQAHSIVKFMNACHPGIIAGGRKDHRRLIASLKRDYRQIDHWLERHAECRVLRVDFEAIVDFPRVVARCLATFLRRDDLDIEAMARIVRPRTSTCYDGMLEASLIQEATP